MSPPISSQRRHIRVSGVVQGVGFRPFVWRLAKELSLAGWVRNDAAGVEIEAEGEAANLAAFSQRLQHDAPRLARVDGLVVDLRVPCGEDEFAILPSAGGRTRTAIAHDVATCPDCLSELFDQNDRRWRYPFINCTQCGPRYTITQRLPYDRANTSMARFPLCPACRHEYEDPSRRRFHAEPNACPVCGPRLSLLDGRGQPIGGDPVAATLALLRQGAVVAIKGLGGFHLVCDARNSAAVAALRQRKEREEKPLAVMLASLASARTLAAIDSDEATVLESTERPIVLLRKGTDCDSALAGVAPGVAWLGVMLPYTPLHWLLFHEAAGRPAGTAWMGQFHELVLVMTSANPGGEPLVTGNDEALIRLAGIADAYLLHDRDILVRCDDSVARVVAAPEQMPRTLPTMQFIRRARGYTPRAIKLSGGDPAWPGSVLALGGWFKNTICVTRGDEAFVSQHIGDLDNASTCAAFESTVEHLCGILQVEPTLVAHDLHPDFFSSRYAADWAAQRGLSCVPVQHHHAHIGAVLAEHGQSGPVIGLALDGVGLGTDGAAWGGELLRVDGCDCSRLGHLQALHLAGGDRAAHEPWRMAAAALHALGRGHEIATRFADQAAADTVAKMLERQINCPTTTSMGRLFDAAAGLLGIRLRAAFEGQAAMLCEGLAETYGPIAAMSDGWHIGSDGALDFGPLLGELADCRDAGRGAALFHATLIEALSDWVAGAAGEEQIDRVALGGGCFLNHILSRGLRRLLAKQGLQVFEAQRLPPNDGGLSLGQAWVAMQRSH
jgi:hydrogenase maturation protein HypF